MDSQDMEITYKSIQERAAQDALGYMPDFPKLPNQIDFTLPEDHAQHCFEAWESFIAELEDLDAYDIAHESCEWDWVIYYHRALELCQAVPRDVLSDAEEQWGEQGGYMGDDFGLYKLAVQLAAIIVTREIADAVEQCRHELLELANDKLDQI